ncbi:MAG: hypothetical protein KKC75_08805 [Nanoarchaeota archaeon]|nr:hypothetical protein [Nanoarchaeota archaeon]MBU1004960.1 hypothetical protein [Nanoarchaeota archaeon]MBU1946400.1 hypothetical protein [Nanoarchaeota archaeon]
MFNKLKGTKGGRHSREFFGRLLLFFILLLAASVYSLLIYERILSKIKWIYLVIGVFALLFLLSLIIFFKYFFSFMGRFIREWKEVLAHKREQNLLEKQRKKEAADKLKKEQLESEELEKKKKEEELKGVEAEQGKIQDELGRKLAEDQRIKEIKKGEKIFQKDEKKIATKTLDVPKSNHGKYFCFILFILSVLGFFASYFYSRMEVSLLFLLVMFISLFFFRLINHKNQPSKKSPEEHKDKPIQPINGLSGKKVTLGPNETDLDALYKLVMQEGRIKVSVLAKYFNVDRKKIEEWASILESHNLIEIHYPPVGEQELRKCRESISTQ